MFDSVLSWLLASNRDCILLLFPRDSLVWSWIYITSNLVLSVLQPRVRSKHAISGFWNDDYDDDDDDDDNNADGVVDDDDDDDDDDDEECLLEDNLDWEDSLGWTW